MRVEHGPTVTARGDDTGSLNPLSLARHGPSGLPSMRRPLGPGSRIPPPCRAAGPTTASRQGPAGSAGSPCRATALATVRTPACSPRTAVAMPRPSGTVSGKAGAPSVRAHYCRPLLPAPSKTASGPHTAPGGCAASRKGQCLKRSAPRGQRPALRALPPGAQRLHQGGPPRRAGRLAVAASAASAPRAGSAPPTGYCTTPCRPPVELPANGFAVGPRGPASYKRS